MPARVRVITPLDNADLAWDQIQCPICSYIFDRTDVGIAMFIMEESFICRCGGQLIVPPIPSPEYQ